MNIVQPMRYSAASWRSPSVPRSEFLAVLRMLARRATLLDRWRAWRNPGHWLHEARRELKGIQGPPWRVPVNTASGEES